MMTEIITSAVGTSEGWAGLEDVNPSPPPVGEPAELAKPALNAHPTTLVDHIPTASATQ